MAERRRLDVVLSALGTRSFRRDFGAVGQSVRGVEGRVGALNRRLQAGARRVRGFGIAFLGAGAAAAAGATKFVNVADDIDKASLRASIARSSLQELRFAADLSGVSAEKLSVGLEGLNKRLGEARGGTGTLITLLKKTNPELLRMLQSAGSTEEGFDILTEAISQLSSEQDRAALANAAFGRQGLALLPLLSQGRDGVEALRQEFRDLGLGLTDEVIDAAVVAKDNFTRLTTSARFLALSIGSRLAPQLQSVSQRLVDSLPKVRAFIDSIGGGKTVITGLAALLAGGLVVAIVAVGAAIGGIPLIVGGAVAALVAGGALIVRKWDAVKKFFVGIWESPLVQLLSFLTPIRAIIALASVVIDNWTPIRTFFGDLFKFLLDKLTSVVRLGNRFAAFLGFGERTAGIGFASPEATTAAARSLASPPTGAVSGGAPAAGQQVSGSVGVDVRVSDDRVSATVVRGEATGIELDAAAGPALAAAR